MKDVPKPDRRLKYDAAFRAEALCLAEQAAAASATTMPCPGTAQAESR